MGAIINFLFGPQIREARAWREARVLVDKWHRERQIENWEDKR